MKRLILDNIKTILHSAVVAGLLFFVLVFPLKTSAAQLFDTGTNVIIDGLGGEAVVVPKVCIPDSFVLGTGLNANLINCVIQQMKGADENTLKELRALAAKQQREEMWDKIKESLFDARTGAFRVMLSQFANQLAYDTATFIASGGQGQKPLFITEGIGTYLQNTADQAVGSFIDSLDRQWGTNLCKPNFEVRVNLIRGLDPRAPRQPSCTFTKFIGNWQSAISDPTFSVEYQRFLKPGENDISSFLILQTGLGRQVDQAVNNNALSAVINDGFKDFMSKNGEKILTPGTFLKKQHELAMEEAAKSDTIFTGTAWDFIATFLDTLTGQLLKNLTTGFFSNDSDDGDSGRNFRLPNLSGLFNPDASPYTEGRLGAQERFSNLTTDRIKVGGPYNILNKLSACTDAARTNLGPTDCVIDTNLATAIRNITPVKDLSEDIRNRRFAPPINTVSNPQNEFTLRNVTILRKYRIVPVGWEVAAKKLSERTGAEAAKVYTLGELMNEFNNPNSEFYQLINPNWLLKAPELFCRREAFGEKNDFATAQDNTIRRATYCADEQQCIREDDSGKCLAYGYCTEEARTWDFNGKTCNPVFNTCQNYVDRNGKTVSYLANTLDYRNCTAENAGCRWYSLALNPISNAWSHVSESRIANTLSNGGTISVTGSRVAKWHNQSSDNQVLMSQACTEATCSADDGCVFDSANNACVFTKSCTVTPGADRCEISSCVEVANNLNSLNPSFASCNGWNAQNWQEGYSGNANRHSCVVGGRSNNALEAYSLTPISEAVVTRLIDVPVSPNSQYQVSFFANSISQSGSFAVTVRAGETVLSSIEVGAGSGWREYRSDYITIPAPFEKVTLEIITAPFATGRVLFDDVKMSSVAASCAARSVWLINTASETNSQKMYLDRDVQGCDGKDAGCTEFIRTTAGSGSNRLPNGGFEIVDPANPDQARSWNGGRRSNERVHTGSQAMIIDVTSAAQNIIHETPISLEARQQFVLSAWVYTSATTTVNIKLTDSAFTSREISAGNWTQVKTSLLTSGVQSVTPSLILNTASGVTGRAYIDSVKLESVTINSIEPTAFTPYEPSQRPAAQLAYLKKAPDYLGCYDADPATPGNQWPTTEAGLQIALSQGNQLCANYSQVCTPDEVGCELYTPSNKVDPSIPGRATSADFCPVVSRDSKEVAICNGYQVYRQEQTNFTSGSFRQFIADSTPRYCSAVYAGCDEFTNLDAVERGGESREYYTQIRACQKPGSDEASYYTWEGSDAVGYQLRSYSLKQSDKNTGPCTNLTYPDDRGGAGVCSDVIPPIDQATPANAAQLSAGICTRADMLTNTDCREFYDRNGATHYRLLSRTITVTDNCHPYRRTQTQATVAEAATDCRANQGYWNTFNECVYMAVPQEGRQCPAAMRGCREYTGNRGNNVKNVINSTFEGSADSWNFGTLSSEANYPGGSSLTNKNANNTLTQQLTRSVTIGTNKAYTLSFWAKGSDTFDLTSIRFQKSPNEEDYFARATTTDGVIATLPPVTLTSQWQRYDLGPVFVTWDPGTEDVLQFNIPSGQTIYLDNVILKEVQQKVYLVENSWFTPVACDNKIDDPTGAKAIAAGTCDQGNINPTGPSRCAPGEMIGCSAYTNRLNQVINVKSFDRLCRPGAVGCEALIDTKNSDSPYSADFNTDDMAAKVSVPADETVYLVNDAKYNCGATAKGCMAFGLPTFNSYDEVSGYQTVYLRNQPDRYTTDLCRQNALWCEAYAGDRQNAYFKDPQNRLCEYKQLAVSIDGGATTTRSVWVRKGTDELCQTSVYQTIGQGGGVEQPFGWYDNLTGNVTSTRPMAGLCPAAQNTCTEFIDPLASTYNNVLRPDATVVPLESNKLYTISATATSTQAAITINCGSDIWSPDGSMPDGQLIRNDSSGVKYTLSGRFYLPREKNRTCTITYAGGIDKQTVRIVPSGVYYVLANSVDDRSCNGLADINKGCVLLNDRRGIDYAQTDTSKRLQGYLTLDADATYVKQLESPEQPPVAGVARAGENDANAIIKVSPDRTCSAWLQCSTYERDTTAGGNSGKSIYGNFDRCLDLTLCTALDENGECAQIATGATNATARAFDISTDQTKTGYSVLSADQGKSYYPFEQMQQIGGAATVINGNFESTFGNTSEPVGWQIDVGQSTEIDIVNLSNSSVSRAQDVIGWSADRFSIVRDPKNAVEGLGYLRLNSKYRAYSDVIDVEPTQRYILTAWINTLDLKANDNNQTASAEVYIEGNVDVSSTRLESGQGWQKRVIEFTANSNEINLRLENRASAGTGEETNGFSRFDAISIKPVLQANDVIRVDRTCRSYPDQAAASCNYIDGNNVYQGQYGYCVTPDPQNPKQCLQWLPIDQLQGETADEISAYSGRRPLYYCIEKGLEKVNVGTGGILVDAGEELPEDYASGIKDIDSNGQIQFQSINVAKDFRSLFRWPYIQRLSFIGSYVGVGVDKKPYIVPLWAHMYRDKVCIFKENKLPVIDFLNPNKCPLGCRCLQEEFSLSEFINLGPLNFLVDLVDSIVSPIVNAGRFLQEDVWGGWGVVGVGLDGAPIPIPVSWHAALGDSSGGITQGLLTAIQNIPGFSEQLGFTRFGMKIVTDLTGENSSLPDPVPQLDGDILGMAWFLDASDQYASGVIGGVSGRYQFEYCKRMVQVVTAAGTNKAYAGRTATGSTFRSQNQDCVFNSELPRTYDYENRTFPAYCVIQDLTDRIYTFNETVQSTDYRPFGAIVQPEGQYPYDWDSKDAPGIQPLFYEVGNPSLQPPYQPRMGQLHSLNSLRQLFARSYEGWQWDTEDKRYELVTEDNDNPEFIWGLPTENCPGGVRPIPDSADDLGQSAFNYCKINPTVANMRFTPSTISGNGATKLEFTVKVDPEQLPLRSYTVDWGNSVTSVSGVSLRDRANRNEPMSLYHYYDYYQLKEIDDPATGADGIDCRISGSCTVSVTITARDNWNASSAPQTTFITVTSN